MSHNEKIMAVFNWMALFTDQIGHFYWYKTCCLKDRFQRDRNQKKFKTALLSRAVFLISKIKYKI